MNNNEFLVNNYKDFVSACGLKYHMCKKFIEFEDFKQRTFLRFLKGVGYNPNKGMSKFSFMCLVATCEAMEVVRYCTTDSRNTENLSYSPKFIDSEGNELYSETSIEDDYTYIDVEKFLKKLDKLLTPRQKEIVKYKLVNYTNTDIARKLGISPQYISFEMKKIIQKANRIKL